MTHPLDLHPLHQVASEAWNEIRKENQPVYAELPISFKSNLLDTAARVESGDPNVVFECRVAEKLAAKAQIAQAAPEPEAPEAEAQVTVEDEPEEVTTQEEKDFLELKGHLPADFPAYDKLHEAGINTYPQLSKVEDLTQVEGVGPATVKAIKKRLKADSKALNK